VNNKGNIVVEKREREREGKKKKGREGRQRGETFPLIPASLHTAVLKNDST
jgi:hypothetical protein